jgi:hypothetical protein
MCAAVLHAQPAAVQQLQNTQQQLQFSQFNLPVGTNAPELYPGENEDVGPQIVLRVNPRPKYFDVMLDSQLFYSDNANFAEYPNNIGSWVFVNTAQAAFEPPPMPAGPGKIAPAAGFSSQWYNYENDRMSMLDFNAQTFFLNGRYLVGKWQAGLGANYTRLLSQSSYNQTYREFLPALSVQRAFPIGDKMLFIVGDLVDYHFTKVPQILGSRTDINNHFDNILFLTFDWQLTRHLLVQPSYRFQYSNYGHNTLLTSDRNDYLDTLGITVLYSFNQSVAARVFFNYNTKQSDDALTPSYNELNGGLGAALDVRF